MHSRANSDGGNAKCFTMASKAWRDKAKGGFRASLDFAMHALSSYQSGNVLGSRLLLTRCVGFDKASGAGRNRIQYAANFLHRVLESFLW